MKCLADFVAFKKTETNVDGVVEMLREIDKRAIQVRAVWKPSGGGGHSRDSLLLMDHDRIGYCCITPPNRWHHRKDLWTYCNKLPLFVGLEEFELLDMKRFEK